MKIEFNTKYNDGDIVTFADEAYDITYRKVIILRTAIDYISSCNEPDISYYVHRCEDKSNMYDEWVSECVLSDEHE